LDESISFRPVKPLDCTFLSHGNYSFHNREELFSGIPMLLRSNEAPPQRSR
jgi:hypothetical protein